MNTILLVLCNALQKFIYFFSKIAASLLRNLEFFSIIHINNKTDVYKRQPQCKPMPKLTLW